MIGVRLEMFGKKERSERRANRVRLKVFGTHDRPRLSVRFSNKHVYAQCIDDVLGRTLVFLSSNGKNAALQNLKPNLSGAAAFGKLFGEKAVESGITNVVFDRGSRKYHGCVKAFADATRNAGLLF